MIPINIINSIFNKDDHILYNYDAGYFENVRQAVFNRDQHACQCCGFKATNYQSIVSLNGDLTNIDSLVTVCVFCQQCFFLDKVGKMESGILVWLPEFSQMELNELARILYVNNDYPNEIGKKAEFILNEINERHEKCKHIIGTGDIAQFIEIVFNNKDNTDFHEKVNDIRLFPLNKRIVKEGNLEYNEFPKIVSHWKKTYLKSGAKGINNDMLLRVENIFFKKDKYKVYLESINTTKRKSSERKSDNTQQMTHASLAGKLLSDSAGFFKILADQNEDIKVGMYKNATVYEQIAALIINEPDGVLDDKTHAELSSKLLEDAAEFFGTLGKKNEFIREQMKENAVVFRKIAQFVLSDPNGYNSN